MILTVTATEHRAQRRNLLAAHKPLAALLREAVAPPALRRPTTPTRRTLTFDPTVAP